MIDRQSNNKLLHPPFKSSSSTDLTSAHCGLQIELKWGTLSEDSEAVYCLYITVTGPWMSEQTRVSRGESELHHQQWEINLPQPLCPLMWNWSWHNNTVEFRTRAWRLVIAGEAPLSLITLTRTLLHFSETWQRASRHNTQLRHLNESSQHSCYYWENMQKKSLLSKLINKLIRHWKAERIISEQVEPEADAPCPLPTRHIKATEVRERQTKQYNEKEFKLRTLSIRHSVQKSEDNNPQRGRQFFSPAW